MVDLKKKKMTRHEKWLANRMPFYMHKTHKIEWAEIFHLKNRYPIVDKINLLTIHFREKGKQKAHEMIWLHFFLLS